MDADLDVVDRLLGEVPPHALASDSATEVTIEVAPLSGAHVEVSALVAEPGPLVAMKLQAIMNRAAAKQGTACCVGPVRQPISPPG